MRRINNIYRVIAEESLLNIGLNLRTMELSITYVYELLDGIDAKLQEGGSERLSCLIELANLSAIIGNLFRNGIVKYCGGSFVSNKPHTYPDLISTNSDDQDLEIKVALESNKPKGHLVKPGAHLIIRYVLGAEDGSYSRGRSNRGDVVWIWEIRAGFLTEAHFNFSSTEGDSGKTAVINAAGMDALSIVYCDLKRCPLSPKGRAYASLVAAIADSL